MARTYILIGSLGVAAEHRIEPLLDWFKRYGPHGDYNVLLNWQFGQDASPRGFAYTYNRLLSAAFADPECAYAWVLGDDVVPVDRCLVETQQAIEADPTIGVIFPVEAWREGEEHVTSLPFTGERLSIFDALHLANGEPYVEQIFAGFACACIRREAWEIVGPMDESLGRGYCEDADWGIRCWRAGYRVVNYRKAWFMHERGATYNRLVADGVMRAQEPYDAAERLKRKWPFMWAETAQDIMTRLKGWYMARRPASHREEQT